MDYVVLDFETYYSSADGLTLRKLSIPEYIGHKDFKVHCLGVLSDGKRTVLWGDEAIQKYLDQWRHYTGDYAFVFHNAFFDLAILKWRYNFVPARVTCTLLMANHVLGSAKDSGHGNSLAELAELLGLEAKGRIDFMDGVRDPDEGQRAALEVYLGTDLSLGRKVLDTLLPHVTNPDSELWFIDHTLKLYVNKPFTLNFDTVARAEKLIETRRTNAVKRLIDSKILPDELVAGGIDKIRDLLTSNKQYEQVLINGLKTYGASIPRKIRKLTKAETDRFAKLKREAAQPALDQSNREVKAKIKRDEKFTDYLNRLVADGVDVWDTNGDITIGETKSVPALAKKDEDFIRLSFSPYEGVAALVSARLIERSADTSQSRLAKMRRVAGGLGIMPAQLVYYGAHTGRWSGGGGFNFLNLSNPDREKDIGKKEIATAIREAFEAPPGMAFVSADASQIEPRVSAWIAGQWDLLDKFRNKEDVYSSFISEVLGEKIHKPKGDETPARASHLKLMRHIGKEAVLGLSYSMGWRKFVARLREDPDVVRMFEAGTLSDEFCQKVVKGYRDIHTAITDSWTDLNNALSYAKGGGIREVGPITFRKGKPLGSKLPVVDAILPSGRKMYYRDIRQETRDGEKEWKHGAGQRLYGGLILENMTQSISRDILTESILRMELDYAVPVVLHIYDSITVLVPEDKAEGTAKLLVESLRTVPDWADNRLVLDAESKIGKTLVT